ncbi:hypothetical protein B0F90DRAFT_1748903, partial [Multifurca ochricompacta]
TAVELAFLKATISKDETEMRRRIDELQRDEIYPYLSIRAYYMVYLRMYRHPIYPRVLSQGKEDPSAILLDVGCCIGTDVRKLVIDGYPASQVLGIDLRPEFLTLGHKLYGDAESCRIHFLAADIFALSKPLIAPRAPSSEATPYIHAGSLFHIWDEPTQHTLALRLVLLLRRRSGSTIFGRQPGLPEAGVIDDRMQRFRFGHSPASWTSLWKTVFEAVDGPEFASTRVKVEAELILGDPSVTPGGDTHHVLFWSVEIL